jgi:hypothetical protein
MALQVDLTLRAGDKKGKLPGRRGSERATGCLVNEVLDGMAQVLRSRIFFHWLYSPLGPWPLLFFQFHDHFTDGRTPWTSDQLIARPLPKHRINTYTHQTSMPCVGFEPMISASELAKTVRALDRSAAMTGSEVEYNIMKKTSCFWNGAQSHLLP